MTNITKHHSEEERKDGNSKECWVDLLVSRDTISVDDLLEGCSELVHFKVCRWFFVRNRLSDRDSRREQLHQETFLLLSDPYLGNHSVELLLKQVERLEYHCLSFEQDPKGFELGVTVVMIRDGTGQILTEFFLSHDVQLFGVSCGVLDLLYLLENLVLVGGQTVFLCVESLTDPCDLGQDVRPGFKNDNECSPGFIIFRVIGNVEGVKDAVALGGPEDHFLKLKKIFGIDDAGYINQSKLFERGL